MQGGGVDGVAPGTGMFWLWKKRCWYNPGCVLAEFQGSSWV